MVSHCALLSLCVKAFHLYRQQKSSFIARTGKLFTNLSYHAGAAISTALRPRITAWALKKLMQSTHIYRVSGVAGYKRKKYAVCGKGRAELPEPDFACRSFRPVGILLGSAFPAKIGGKPGRFGVQCNSSASNKSHGFLCWYEAGGAGGRHQSEPCVSRKCQRQPLRTVGCGTGECPIPSS